MATVDDWMWIPIQFYDDVRNRAFTARNAMPVGDRDVLHRERLLNSYFSFFQWGFFFSTDEG